MGPSPAPAWELPKTQGAGGPGGRLHRCIHAAIDLQALRSGPQAPACCARASPEQGLMGAAPAPPGLFELPEAGNSFSGQQSWLTTALRASRTSLRTSSSRCTPLGGGPRRGQPAAAWGSSLEAAQRPSAPRRSRPLHVRRRHGGCSTRRRGIWRRHSCSSDGWTARASRRAVGGGRPPGWQAAAAGAGCGREPVCLLCWFLCCQGTPIADMHAVRSSWCCRRSPPT